MKGKQIAMDSLLIDLDRAEEERRKHEWAREKEQTDRIIRELDEKYGRKYEKELKELPDGSVVIIAQHLYRNDHYTWHFYRTVMTFSENAGRGRYSVFVQANNEEWPDVPPWAVVVGHENELKDIDYNNDHYHWATGEVVEPIKTWWIKEWEDFMNKYKGGKA